MYKAILISFCMILFTGCYPMPTDEDFCVIPTTNNPDVTRAKEDSLTPNMSY